MSNLYLACLKESVFIMVSFKHKYFIQHSVVMLKVKKVLIFGATFL